jgi:hypothetical protein
VTVVPVRPDARERLEQALFEIRRVIAGQDGMRERGLVCLLTHGHRLIEGVQDVSADSTLDRVLERVSVPEVDPIRTVAA